MTTELALVQSGRLEFSPDQMGMIRDSFANGCSPGELKVLMEVASARRLNPILKQIYFVKRWDSNKGREVWSYQVSIDGLRALAERTGKYDGQDEPEFQYDSEGHLKLAKVKVYRKDWARPAVGVAHWSEYVQTKKDGSVTHMWATKSHIMLAKCAEALAFRKAFPEDMGGLYTSEEMAQADDAEKAPPAAQPAAVAVVHVPVPAPRNGNGHSKPPPAPSPVPPEEQAYIKLAETLPESWTTEEMKAWTAARLHEIEKLTALNKDALRADMKKVPVKA